MPWTRNSTSPPCAISREALSNALINSLPIILRLVSGSLTPASALRKISRASTSLSETPVASTKSFFTCSASPDRSSPWSTKTQVNWLPTACCTIAAATAESTPPDRPQMTFLVPTMSFTFATSVREILVVVHVGEHFATLINQFCNIFCPCSVCKTSGWN